jgi:hypothetical protein
MLRVSMQNPGQTGAASATCEEAAESAEQQAAELMEAVEQMRQLDGMLAGLTSRDSTGKPSLEASDGCPEAPAGLVALLEEERCRQWRAAQVQRALADTSSSSPEARCLPQLHCGTEEGRTEPELAGELMLSSHEEQLLERLLAAEEGSGALPDSTPFSLTSDGAAGCQAAQRLAEIDARY